MKTPTLHQVILSTDEAQAALGTGNLTKQERRQATQQMGRDEPRKYLTTKDHLLD